MRGNIPKPFSRPSISLGGGAEVQREWLTVSAWSLKVGDTVAGDGVITKVEKSNTMVSIYLPQVVITALPNDQFLAFVEATQVG